MPERKRLADRKSDRLSLQELRQKLVIDRDDLDTALVEQPELFYHAAEAHAMAIAERDATKLALEETNAEQDKRIREHAFRNDIKITEPAIERQIKLVPLIK